MEELSPKDVHSLFHTFREAVLDNTSDSIPIADAVYHSLKEYLSAQESMAIGIARKRIKEAVDQGKQEFTWVCTVVEGELVTRLQHYRPKVKEKEPCAGEGNFNYNGDGLI